MPKNYDALEGELTVRGQASASRISESEAVSIVGGYDSANATAEVTAGETLLIADANTANETFGDSEIARLAQSVAANEVSEIYAAPVPETETTETFASTASFTLTNTPLFDPTVHPDHDITVTDTVEGVDVTVNIVYEDAPATPSNANTVNLNPINGAVEADASSDYEVTYTFGDYTTPIQNAADEGVRSLIVGTESPSVKSTLSDELASRASDFDFMRGYTGATPNIDAGNIGSYTPDEQNWRVVEVAPARATGSDGPVRTVGAVGGFLSGQPIGPDGSGLYESVNGLTGLATEYRPSEASNFDGVTALTRNAIVATAQTTSTEPQFEDIYAVEVIDRVALGLFGVARDYAGGPQDINDLETLLETECQAFARGSPPLLGFGDGRDTRPYSVDVSLGASRDEADAAVSIVPFPVAKTVNLSLTVTDGFVEFAGAN